MAAVKIVLNRAAVRTLLRSGPVQADLRRRAARIAARAGEGHVIAAGTGPNRARVAVIAASIEARVAEAHERTLTKSIDAGR